MDEMTEYLAVVDAAVAAMSTLLMATKDRRGVETVFWPRLVEADQVVNDLQDTVREMVGWVDPLDRVAATERGARTEAHFLAIGYVKNDAGRWEAPPDPVGPVPLKYHVEGDREVWRNDGSV